MIAVGIDPGIAHTGFALFVDARLEALHVLVTKRRERAGDTQARLAEVLNAVAEWLDPFDDVPDVIVVEWPVVGGRRGDAGRGSSSSAAAMTFAAAGALIGMLRDRAGMLLAPVPSSWRAAIGAHRGQLDIVLAQLDRQHAITARVGKMRAPHALDAIGLARYGQQHLAALAA